MSNNRIGFIGGGNMTRAIVGGLLADGFAARQIFIADPNNVQRNTLRDDFPGITVAADNGQLATQSDCLVLAVKPQVLRDVCLALAPGVQSRQLLFVSIAAGVRSSDIDAWLGGDQAIVRAMPNQPALLRRGISGVFANERSSEEQRAMAISVLSAVGPVIAVEREAEIDAVTAVSGSGPAYFFLLIDMLASTGAELGLDESAARQLAIQTAVGAAALADHTDDSMEELIARVRSPGGTTAAALDSLDDDRTRDIFRRAVTAARDRATELADAAHNQSQD